MTDDRLDALADRLADLLVDRVADRLVELTAQPHAAAPLDAAEVARRLGVTRATVYGLADELGAVRLGDGEKPRLRFDPARVDEYLAHRTNRSSEHERAHQARRHPRRSSAPLLPIAGESR